MEEIRLCDGFDNRAANVPPPFTQPPRSSQCSRLVPERLQDRHMDTCASHAPLQRVTAIGQRDGEVPLLLPPPLPPLAAFLYLVLSSETVLKVQWRILQKRLLLAASDSPSRGGPSGRPSVLCAPTRRPRPPCHRPVKAPAGEVVATR